MFTSTARKYNKTHCILVKIIDQRQTYIRYYGTRIPWHPLKRLITSVISKTDTDFNALSSKSFEMDPQPYEYYRQTCTPKFTAFQIRIQHHSLRKHKTSNRKCAIPLMKNGRRQKTTQEQPLIPCSRCIKRVHYKHSNHLLPA